METIKLGWLRLYTEIVDDEKLRLLAFEDRWHFVAILCLKRMGILDDSDAALMKRKVAVKLGLHAAALDEVVKRLADVGLIDRRTLCPIAWADRQFESDSSQERTRRYRERHAKTACLHAVPVDETSRKRHSDVTVTMQDTEAETDSKDSYISPMQSLIDIAPPQPDAEGHEAAAKGMSKLPECPHLKILDAWSRSLPAMPRHDAALWRGTRRAHLQARWRETAAMKHWKTEGDGIAYFEKLFRYIGKSAFLTGRAQPSNGHAAFVIELEWLIRPLNWAKVLEGKYHQEAA